MKSLQKVAVLAVRSTRGTIAQRGINEIRFASSTTEKDASTPPQDKANSKNKEALDKLKKTHKSMADLDAEMKQAMENLSGDGGEYGLELEGGKAVAMKRSVKDNMFRYI